VMTTSTSSGRTPAAVRLCMSCGGRGGKFSRGFSPSPVSIRMVLPSERTTNVPMLMLRLPRSLR